MNGCLHGNARQINKTVHHNHLGLQPPSLTSTEATFTAETLKNLKYLTCFCFYIYHHFMWVSHSVDDHKFIGQNLVIEITFLPVTALPQPHLSDLLYCTQHLTLQVPHALSSYDD